MEKNGAIGGHTPCQRPDCCRKNEKVAKQRDLPFDDTAAYDKAEDGLMKQASDAVKNASKK
jgi:alkyl sulfatase BDS1-like metallo-beta-lactamase superfamily hydrolase